MFGIIKLTIHTITGMWVSIVLFKLMTNGWSGFYFQCCVLSLEDYKASLKYLSDHPKLQGIAQQNSFKHT